MKQLLIACLAAVTLSACGLANDVSAKSVVDVDENTITDDHSDDHSDHSTSTVISQGITGSEVLGILEAKRDTVWRYVDGDTTVVFVTDTIFTTVQDTVFSNTTDTIVSVIQDTVTVTVLDTVWQTVRDTVFHQVIDTVTTVITDTVEVNNLIPDAEPAAPVDTTVPRDTSITLIHPTLSAKRTYQGKVFNKRFYLNNVYDFSDDGYQLYSYRREYTNGGDQRTFNEYYLPNRCGELNAPSHGNWNFAIIVTNGNPQRVNSWYTMPGWRIFDASDIEYLGNAIQQIVPENLSVVADNQEKIENKANALQVVNSNGETNVEIPPKYYMCVYDLKFEEP